MNYEEYKKDLEKVEIEQLEGKETEEIDIAKEKVTVTLKGAVEKHVPKISSRTLLHPEIYLKTKEMMEEARRIKMLLFMSVDYIRNRRRLTELRELIRERWWRKNNMVDKVDKVDMEKIYGDFWMQVN